jgi:uncharacterized protein (DUF305 family)
MPLWFPRPPAAAPLVLVTVVGCGAPTRTPATQAGPDRGPPSYTAADARFMSGMIVHHAQAVLIAGWAPTHGAGPAVRTLCERIVVAQRDEIAFMRRWLGERGEPVPDADATHAHGGMLMPGMLTPEQLAELDRARGPEFDRLFLRSMIQHHEGALTMVETLFGSHGAAQDEDVFKFAADVNADQTTEIDRMRTMLDAPSSGGRTP